MLTADLEDASHNRFEAEDYRQDSGGIGCQVDLFWTEHARDHGVRLYLTRTQANELIDVLQEWQATSGQWIVRKP